MGSPIKVEILNEILYALKDGNSFLISAFLSNRHKLDKDYCELYQIRLLKDGYISLKLISANRHLARITASGKLFINDGGYKRTAEEIAMSIINKGATKSNNKPGGYDKVSVNLLTSDKSVIKHVLTEIQKIQGVLLKCGYFTQTDPLSSLVTDPSFSFPFFG